MSALPLYFQALTRHTEIGSSSFSLYSESDHLILDAGMHPKRPGEETLPQFDLITQKTLQSILITHAHLDHVGTLPVLAEQQPQAQIYSTLATKTLAEAILHNSVNVMTSQSLELNIPSYPLYSHQDLDELQERWQDQPYLKPFNPTPNITASFYDAGHILGSAGVFLQASQKTIFYTGDVQFNDQALITGARFSTDPLDVLIMETTRGTTDPKHLRSRSEEYIRFIQSIRETLEEGGTVLIPVFAMGKTQEVLTMIHQAKEEEALETSIPVHIGGLSTKMTLLYDQLADDTPRTTPGFKLFEDMDIASPKHRPRRKKRKPLVSQPSAIFALSSGMMSEHTVSNNFASGFIQNPKNSILFVGYADPDSPAAAIRQASTGDRIHLNQQSPPEQLLCRVEEFDFSGHANRDELVNYACRTHPKQVFLVHGDRPATDWFQQELQEKLPNSELIVPTPGKPYQLF